MPIIECNDKGTFDREIKNAKSKLVVIDFHATWCGPCKMIAPKYAEFSEKYKQQCVFLKVDVDKNKETAQDCKVEAMPTFVFFHEGRMIDTMKGADAGKLEQLIKKHADQYSKYAFKGPGNVLGAPTAGAAAAAAKPAAGAGGAAASSGPPRRNPWADPNFMPKSAAPAPTTTAAKPTTTSSSTSNPAAAAWANKDLSKPATPAATPATTTAAKPTAAPVATPAPAPATTTATPAVTPAATTATPTPASTSTTIATPAATPTPATTTASPAPAAAAGHDPRLQVNAVLLQQLIDMGFSKIRSEKALILTKNISVENAMNWLLEHESDVDIDEPLQVVGTQSKAAGAPLGMQDDILAGNEDLDDEAKRILMQARANANAKPSASAPVAASGEKKVTEMTSEEKMQWLAKKREDRKVRLEKEAIEKARVSERSRVAINKAAGDMKEKIEEEAAKAAYTLKKKEEKEKNEARRRVKEKLAADKERRKKEQEQLLAKIAAEKAAAANKK